MINYYKFHHPRISLFFSKLRQKFWLISLIKKRRIAQLISGNRHNRPQLGNPADLATDTNFKHVVEEKNIVEAAILIVTRASVSNFTFDNHQ